LRTDCATRPNTLFIACGAIAKEVAYLAQVNEWYNVQITCLPASWHNTPKKIAPAIKSKIQKFRKIYDKIYVLYGDCGTGGELDEVLEKEEIERISGPHCYEFFMGRDEFLETHCAEPGCFYLTDYLARHFDRLVIKGLGLDKYPILLEDYFKHYKKLIYIAQTNDLNLQKKAEKAANYLGLSYEYRFRGYGDLGAFLESKIKSGLEN
tara:strand:- start:3446 stop:4069 length:624 start_codon:yes stop_codon:yes gene_type:complete